LFFLKILQFTHAGTSAAERLAACFPRKEWTMLYWAAVFFVIALVAALFGFGGIAAGAAEIAKILFFIFLVVFAVTLVLGLIGRR
jgi:uncharacterized membrane protein YtjA (UPF0391 family)